MLQISADLLTMSSDAAVLVKNRKVVFANAEACVLLGYDCVGKTVRALFSEEIAGIQAGSYIGEFPIDGKRYILRVSASEGIQVMFLSEIEDKDSLISDAFLFSLRNCLMSIDVSLSLLRHQAAEQPGIIESLKLISHESFRINRIMSNASTIRSIRTNQIPFNPIKLDLSSFLKSTLDSVGIIAGGPSIKYNAPAELKIYADPALIESLVLNLISNCLLHARDCSRISVNLVQGKESCFISVDDDGCGIEPENLHSVFNRYLHHYELSDMSKGPGLGLTTARAIAGLHGGTLMLESQPGRGTAVRVSLAHNPYRNSALSQNEAIFEPNIKSLLTGLADCLPSELFCDKYFD